MTGLDTNVLVRLLTRDDLRQFTLAQRFIRESFSVEEPAFVNRIVLVELVWVLESAYDEYGRGHIAAAVEGLLNAAHFRVEDGAAMRTAVSQYRAGADFADAAIATINALQGCETTATFDKEARKRLPHFSAVPDRQRDDV